MGGPVPSAPHRQVKLTPWRPTREASMLFEQLLWLAEHEDEHGSPSHGDMSP